MTEERQWSRNSVERHGYKSQMNDGAPNVDLSHNVLCSLLITYVCLKIDLRPAEFRCRIIRLNINIIGGEVWENKFMDMYVL